MALINCPECNKEISNTVKKCPNCGYKFKRKRGKKEPRFIKTKKQKRIVSIVCVIFIFALLGTGAFLGYKYYLVPLKEYKAAENLVKNNKFDDAISAFEGLAGFMDSKTKVLQTHYLKAEYLLESESYEEAIKEFELAGEYNDSVEKINETKYEWADKVDVDKAIDIYEELDDYKDSKDKLQAAKQKKEAENALEKISSAYSQCSDSGTTLSSDKKSITVDATNEYDYSSNADIVIIISALGLPDSLFDEMCATNALMGRQTETYDYYEVSWSFHPDNGLDAIFKYKN